MNTPVYRQRRKGSFVATIIPRGQCGFEVGQNEFTYDVEILVNRLDANGWVLDNRDLDKIFDCWCKGQWQASCEDMAGGGICAILDLLGQRALQVSCTISPNEFASLGCQWSRGDSRPTQVPSEINQELELSHANGL